MGRRDGGGDIFQLFQIASPLWLPRQRTAFLMLPHDKWQKKGKYHFKQRLIIFMASANFLSPRRIQAEFLQPTQSREEGAPCQRWAPHAAGGRMMRARPLRPGQRRKTGGRCSVASLEIWKLIDARKQKAHDLFSKSAFLTQTQSPECLKHRLKTKGGKRDYCEF